MNCCRCPNRATVHTVAFQMVIHEPKRNERGSLYTKGVDEPHTISLQASLCNRCADLVYKALKRVLGNEPFELGPITGKKT